MKTKSKEKLWDVSKEQILEKKEKIIPKCPHCEKPMMFKIENNKELWFCSCKSKSLLV